MARESRREVDAAAGLPLAWIGTEERMAMPVAAKVALWAAGGIFVLGCGGVLFLYGAAGIAMWRSSQSIEREQAAERAAYNALTPAQKVEKARAEFERTHDAGFCLAILAGIPSDAPGRAELMEAARTQQKKDEAAQAAMEAMTPEQHLAAARTALDKGDFPTCRGHLFYVPKETPGCEALMAEERAKEDAAEAAAGQR
ncbi:MAG: hypothetical protein JST05_07715 [Acidobacteria bacterium]|nr:hypothetical protein [Acidobacteriota bacterium]